MQNHNWTLLHNCAICDRSDREDRASARAGRCESLEEAQGRGTMKNTNRYRCVLFASVAGACVAVSAPVMAQDAADTGDNAGREIVVTGTLLRQKNESAPLAVLSGGEIAARGIRAAERN